MFSSVLSSSLHSLAAFSQLFLVIFLFVEASEWLMDLTVWRKEGWNRKGNDFSGFNFDQTTDKNVQFLIIDSQGWSFSVKIWIGLEKFDFAKRGKLKIWGFLKIFDQKLSIKVFSFTKTEIRKDRFSLISNRTSASFTLIKISIPFQTFIIHHLLMN